MSVHVMSWVLRHSEATLGKRLVLLALADSAEDDGGNAWPSVATLAMKARLSERQVQYALRQLAADGAIQQEGRHRTRDQRYGTHVYRVLMKGADSAPLEDRRVQSTTLKGAILDTQRVQPTAPEPSLEPSLEPSKDLARAREPGIYVNGRRWSVDRQPVNSADGRLAAQILHEWNAQTGQALRSRDWLAKIVMRLREYPEADFDDHRLIIATALAQPWWRGAATPSVVYGNGAQFERAIQQVRERVHERSIDLIVAAATRSAA